MVVCTLCSCYPWEMLGLPPIWYKAAPYRSRAVKDPRGVLADFGLSLPKANRDPGMGFDRRDPLPGAADAPRGHRRLERAAACRTRDARLHDRHRLSQDAAVRHHEWRARHGRHGRLRQGRARTERADVSHRMGRAGAGDGPRHGGSRRLQHRHLALLPGNAAARMSISAVPIIGNGCSGSKTC